MCHFRYVLDTCKCLLARDPLAESPRLPAHLFLSQTCVMVMQTAFPILPLLSPEGMWAERYFIVWVTKKRNHTGDLFSLPRAVSLSAMGSNVPGRVGVVIPLLGESACKAA